MKYSLHVLVILTAALLLYFGVFSGTSTQPSSGQQVKQPSDTAEEPWGTKTDDQPPVTVKVTPIEFGKDRETWKFRVILDTHFGSLDDDPLTAVSLAGDSGNSYRPISWEGLGPGGHHREGVLAFEAVNPAPSYIELKVKNVGGVPERSFRWSIE